MIPKNIKILLSIVLIVLSFYQFYEDFIGNGIFYLFLSLFLILLYFKNEYIFFSFLKLRKHDFIGTKKWLDRIKNPEKILVKKQIGYYHYLYGIIESQKNLTQAEKSFRKALSYGLSMSTDLAMAKLSLAGILIQKRRKREATILITEAKKSDKHNMLGEQIKLLKNQIKKI
tara:strand:+ start:2476 stop:2991 length:516 start_codon:yes stop_codon:yes gene_type:complete